MDAIERRAAWEAIMLAIVFAFAVSGGVAFGIGGLGTWELVVYIGGIVSLGVAGVLLVAAMAPDFVRPFTLEERSRFVFFAFALVVVAIVATIALSAHAAIHAYQHPNG